MASGHTYYLRSTTAPMLERKQWSKRKMQDLQKREGTGKIIDEYGGFRRIDDWKLTRDGRPCDLDGFVVQKVKRELIVQKRLRTVDEKKNWLEAVSGKRGGSLINPERGDGWVTVAPEEIATWAAEGCSFHLDCDEYWECFDVTRGKIEDGDQFMSGAFRPPDDELAKYQFRGAYAMHGVARFFPLSSDQKKELMEALKGVPLANGLPSTAQDPFPILSTFLPQFTGVSNEEKLTVYSRWDSNVEFGDSVVTPHRGH